LSSIQYVFEKNVLSFGGFVSKAWGLNRAFDEQYNLKRLAVLEYFRSYDNFNTFEILSHR